MVFQKKYSQHVYCYTVRYEILTQVRSGSEVLAYKFSTFYNFHKLING